MVLNDAYFRDNKGQKKECEMSEKSCKICNKRIIKVNVCLHKEATFLS